MHRFLLRISACRLDLRKSHLALQARLKTQSYAFWEKRSAAMLIALGRRSRCLSFLPGSWRVEAPGSDADRCWGKGGRGRAALLIAFGGRSRAAMLIAFV